MVTRRNGKRPNKTQRGLSAVNKIYKQSRDYVLGEITKRYGGPKGKVTAAADIARIARMMNTENKYIDTLLDVTCDKSTPYCAALNNVAEGSDNTNRTGRSVRVIKYDIMMKLYFSTGTVATSVGQSQFFKWFLVRFNKTTPSGQTFAIADFLNQDSSSAYTVISLPNTDRSEDFQIMASGEALVQLQLTTGVSSQAAVWQTVSHDCSFHQEYSGTSNSTICDNNVQLVIVGGVNANTGGVSGVTYSIRCWYVDN